MGTSLAVNIPKELHVALEKSSAKFPLPSVVKMAKVVPSFRESSNPPKCIQYDKIIELLDGKYTRILYGRHASVLDKMSRILVSGIPVSDLNDLLRVLKILKKRIDDGGKVLLDSIPKFVALFSAPIELPSDFTDSPGLKWQIRDIINALAQLTLYDHELAIDAIANAIYSLCGGGKVKPSFEIQFSLSTPIPPIPTHDDRTKYHKVDLAAVQVCSAEESMAIEGLTQAYQYLKTPSHQASVLRTLRRLSKFEKCSAHFISHGTADLLNDVLRDSSNDYVVFVAIEIIWNLLSSNHGKEMAAILGTVESLTVLKILFEHFLINGNRQTEKQLRNEILIIFNQIGVLYSDYVLKFLEIGFVESISLFMVHIELDIDHPDVSHLIFSREQEDYEFKKLMIELCRNVCKNEDVLRVFLNNGLIQFCLTYLDIETNHPILDHWTPHQLRNIQFQIIGLLNDILPKVIDEVLESDSINLITKFLKHVCLPKDMELIEVYTKREIFGLIEATIQLILNISELLPGTSKKQFGNFGVFPILSDIIGNPTYTLDCWRVALITCGSLCFGSKDNKIAFGKTNGVKCVIPLINFDSPRKKEKEDMLIALIECLWGCVCGNSLNEETLLQSLGIFSLLNLLEKESVTVQKHILGCLLDLLENPKAIYHCFEWKSNSNCEFGISNLLIKLWNIEEAKLGIKSCPDGSLIESLDPLAGENQPKRDFTVPSINGRTIEEISENFRAKIYSIFSKLGYERLVDNLDQSQQVKLIFISKYLDLKIGQVWEENYKELDFERMRPITPDQDLFDQSRTHIQGKISFIKTKQQQIISNAEQAEKINEELFLRDYQKNHPIKLNK